MATMQLKTVQPMSDEEFYQFCRENSQYRIEKNKHGKIIIMQPTNSETGNYNNEISYEVTHWNRQTHMGKAFDSSTGFKIQSGATLSPDVSWILNERWNDLPEEERRRFARITPDFVIELRSSPDDSLKDLKEKMEEYIENGVRLAWLLDRISGKAYVYCPNRPISIFENFDTDVLSGEDVLPGFELKLSILK